MAALNGSFPLPGNLALRFVQAQDQPFLLQLLIEARPWLSWVDGKPDFLRMLHKQQFDTLREGLVWLSGAFLMHNRDDDDDRRWGSFGMLSAGADYLITDKALVGLSFHLDRMTDPTDADAKLTGNGWLVGPYSSLEIGKGVYWDTSILYGGSANDIDTAFWDGTFDTKRWMADTAIKGQWRLDEVTVLTPKLRAVYLSEQVDDYTVSNAAGDELTLDGFTSEQLRVSLGAEVARKFTLSNDTTLTPKIGLTGGFAGLDGSGAFGTVSTGISLATPEDWNLDFSLLFNIEGDGDRYGGARARMSKRF